MKAGGQLAQVACCLVGTVSVLPAGGVSLLQVYDRVAYVAPTVSQPRDPLFEPAIPPPKERFI